MELELLSASSPEPLLREWHRLQVSWHEEGMPGADPPSEHEARAELASDRTADRRGVLALDGDRANGFVQWEAPLCDNHHLAWTIVYVEPQCRQRGVAGVLLAAARDELAAAGRTHLTGDVPEGGAGASFVATAGARRTDVDLRSILDIAGVDDDEVRRLAVAPGGYQLVQFRDRCPDELVDAFAVARDAMNDAPRGDSSYADMHWDRDRVRALETHWLEFGIRSYTTAAVDYTSGAVAGFTEILQVGRPTTAIQEDTGVLRAHRGHGLGLAMKAANLRHITAHEPQVGRIVTWNAESNRYMRAVNERLGFRVAERWFDLELLVGSVHASPRSLL